MILQAIVVLTVLCQRMSVERILNMRSTYFWTFPQMRIIWMLFFWTWNMYTRDVGTGPGTRGAFFVDVPINSIDCFLMGLYSWESGDGYSIVIHVPMAILPPRSFGTTLGDGIRSGCKPDRTGLCVCVCVVRSPLLPTWRNTGLVMMLCHSQCGHQTNLFY